ncbi:MAG TPA: GNAT family N-acetyltransferase [Candidatus Tumulicola sp.]
MSEVHNLVVELDDALSERAARIAGSMEDTGVSIEFGRGMPGDALAWIDETFGGSWSSEAAAGENVVARRDGRPVGFATVDARGLRFRWLHGLASDPNIGLFGPFGVTESERGSNLGRTLLMHALIALRARGFSRALIAAVSGTSLLRYYADATGARIAETFTRAELTPGRKVVVMASGGGTNLQAVIDARVAGRLPCEIAGVLVNRASAFAVERAKRAGIPVSIVTWDRAREPREAYDARLQEAMAALDPEVVILLGWMHLLDERFVRAFSRIVNLHPAFLPLDFLADDVEMPDGTQIPAFRGAHAIRDSVEAGVAWAGATVHDVTPETDRGPVVVRKPVRLRAGEDEAGALERIRPIEHELVVAAILRCLYES